jgi:hypothetical protein
MVYGTRGPPAARLAQASGRQPAPADLLVADRGPHLFHDVWRQVLHVMHALRVFSSLPQHFFLGIGTDLTFAI